MRINHNMSAIFASRRLQEVGWQLDKTIERLASGEMINRAGDDASGLAVSERMRTQIHGLGQAEKNAQNGLSFIQVAEGAFQQLNEVMQRMRVLAVQSANGIYSKEDRQQIQVEVDQLVKEIDRIGTSAEFNRMKLLTGDYAPKQGATGTMFFHVGANKGQRIPVYIKEVSSKALNLDTVSVADVGSANTALGAADKAIDQLNQQRADLGAYYNRLENTIRAVTRMQDNMTAADSRIRDADMASEMVEFTKDQILLQTGAAMLAQANMKPKLIMKLFND